MIKVESLSSDATALIIEEPGSGLDPITVIMTSRQSPSPYRGFITVWCNGGDAWTASFGSISKPMPDWVLGSVSAEYLTEKLSRHSDTKSHKKYLLKIVECVQRGIEHYLTQTSGRDAHQP